jgi:hypothetical protein
MFQETGRQFQMQQEKADRRHRETEQMFKKTARMQRKTERMLQKTEQQHQKTKQLIEKNIKVMKRMNKQCGDLDEHFGDADGRLIASGVIRIFNALGYHSYAIAPNVKIMDESGKVLTEVDLLLDNDDTMIAIEVKAKPRSPDIPYHVNRLAILREHIQRHKKPNKKVIGAIAGAIFDKHIKGEAIDAGLYTITQGGDTVKLDVPSDFQPRIF